MRRDEAGRWKSSTEVAGPPAQVAAEQQGPRHRHVKRPACPPISPAAPCPAHLAGARHHKLGQALVLRQPVVARLLAHHHQLQGSRREGGHVRCAAHVLACRTGLPVQRPSRSQLQASSPCGRATSKLGTVMCRAITAQRCSQLPTLFGCHMPLLQQLLPSSPVWSGSQCPPAGQAPPGPTGRAPPGCPAACVPLPAAGCGAAQTR